MVILDYYIMPSLEQLEQYSNIEEVSTEGYSFAQMKESVIKLCNRIKTIVKNVYRKVVDGLSAAFKWIMDKFGFVEKVYDLADDKDLLELYQKVLRSTIGRNKYILNHDGTVIDFEQFEKDCEEANKSIERDGDFSFPLSSSRNYIFSNNVIIFKEDDVGREDAIKKLNLASVKKNFTQRNLRIMYRGIRYNGIPSEVEQLYKDIEQLNKDVLSNKITQAELAQASKKVNAKNINLKAKLAVYHSLVGLYRGVYDIVRRGDVFAGPVPKGTTLIHLSMDGGLPSRLKPRMTFGHSKLTVKSSFDQIFPTTISFAPSIEECLKGITGHVIPHAIVDPDNNKEMYCDIYVYEGIVDENVRAIKEKYAKTNIAEWNDTHEIPVVTPINVVKKMKIKAHFNKTGMSLFGVSSNAEKIKTIYGDTMSWNAKLLRYEVLEKY